MRLVDPATGEEIGTFAPSNDIDRRLAKDRGYRIGHEYRLEITVDSLMRYQCRLAGKSANYDQRFSGTYHARRDSLEKFWAPAFGHTRGLMVVAPFHENVERADGKNQVVQFIPYTGEPMLVACLWIALEGSGREGA